jgi:hypothetical protein
MKPAKITLSTAAQRFVSSDGALEVDVPAGSLDASQLASTQDSIQPHITQVKPGGGKHRLDGQISFGTYEFQFFVRIPRKCRTSSSRNDFRSASTLKA